MELLKIGHNHLIARSDTSNIDTVFVQTQTHVDWVGEYGVLIIVRKKSEPTIIIPVVNGIEIIRTLIIHECGNRGIIVSGIKNNVHIINQVINIQQYLQIWVTHAIFV